MVKRWVWIFGIVISLLFAIFCYLLYAVWGGKFYFEARKSISHLPLDQKAVAENIFDSKGNYMYSGIYMGVFDDWLKGVWIWGQKGPRFFRSDEFTAYSYFQICTPENLENLNKSGAITPRRDVDSEIRVWADKVKVGDFVAIQLATPEHGGNLGGLREALANDWWVFNSAIPIDKQCKN